jgi:hypothetical protein
MGQEQSLIVKTNKTLNIVIPGMMPYIQRVIDPFLVAYPYWGLAIYSVIGIYMVYLGMKQEELNEVITFIKDHPNEFRKKIVKSEEFRKGFVSFFDNYIKQRIVEKRRILRAILLGFSSDGNKREFELEKMQEALMRISLNALETMVFVKKEIIPLVELEYKNNLKPYKNQVGLEGKRLRVITRQRIVLSGLIDKWISDRYGSNSELQKKLHGEPDSWSQSLRDKIVYEEHVIRNKYTGTLSELANLDILDRRNGTATWGGSVGSGFGITTFGYKFIDYLD